MLVSVFTGVHPTSLPYLPEAYETLREQTYDNWEWVIVPNGGAQVPLEIARDRRVRVYPMDEEPKGVGHIKGFACSKAKGAIFVELDADDLLTPDALERLVDVFQSPTIQFAYSNDAEFHDGTWEPHTYSSYYGWQTRDFQYKGHALKANVAWEPSPHMMRQVFWAPDHVRAWRAQAYYALGGHRSDLAVGDDHDLCCRTYRMYGADGMRHIDEVLYLYRVHDAQTVKTQNEGIQRQTALNYLGHIEGMAIRWAQDQGLRMIDLGGRINGRPGFETVDLFDADILANLDERWPLDDSSVGVLRASHVFEHLGDPIFTMNEAFRVLAPGGFLFCEVPSTDGRGAFQDPTHISFWNENSFWYYTQKEKAAFIKPMYQGRLQVAFLATVYPDQWWKDNDIPVVRADLIALKPPYSDRPVGEVLI